MSGFVYFIGCAGRAGPIKIGYSRVPRERLVRLHEVSPFKLEIKALAEGSMSLEYKIHRCFADCHSHHEWFHPSERLLAAIDAINCGAPIDLAIDLDDVRGDIRRKKGGRVAIIADGMKGAAQ